MSRQIKSAAKWIGLAALLAASPLHAEKADREKPIQVEADRVSLDDLNKLSVFEGNVVLTQGTLLVKADKVTVRQDAEKAQYATALGRPLSFRQKRDGADDYIEGWAERLEYDGKRNQVELFQKARLKRNNDEIRGDYIFYDGVAETFRVGPAASDGAKSATSSTPGRVRMVIQPKPATGNEPAAASPLPLKSSPLINKPREE
jgi:lipopolysaccharide export system protein LptA